jgi:hypothetical protein
LRTEGKDALLRSRLELACDQLGTFVLGPRVHRLGSLEEPLFQLPLLVTELVRLSSSFGVHDFRPTMRDGGSAASRKPPFQVRVSERFTTAARRGSVCDLLLPLLLRRRHDIPLPLPAISK